MSLARGKLRAEAPSLRVDGPQSLRLLLVIVSSCLEWGRRYVLTRLEDFEKIFEFLTLRGWMVEEDEE